MYTINILCVGKIKENYLKEAIDEYSKRLSKYCKLNIIQLNDESVPEKLNDNIIKSIKDKEAEKLLQKLDNTYIISCDLKGKQYTSEQFATKISDLAIDGKSNITFVIGGTLGIGDEVISKSNELICFSKMTFPHQLMRVILLEQLFRTFKINNGETYHR